MTFDELFHELNLTQEERVALVHYLAMLRYRRTIEHFLPQSAPGARQ